MFSAQEGKAFRFCQLRFYLKSISCLWSSHIPHHSQSFIVKACLVKHGTEICFILYDTLPQKVLLQLQSNYGTVIQLFSKFLGCAQNECNLTQQKIKMKTQLTTCLCCCRPFSRVRQFHNLLRFLTNSPQTMEVLVIQIVFR